MGISTEWRAVRRWAHDLSVGRKLFGGFAMLTLILGLVIGCLFLTVARLGDANHMIVDVAAQRSEAADHLRFAAADLRGAQQAYVIDASGDRAEFDQAAGRFETALERVRSLAAGAVEETLVRKIATGYQTFRSTDQMIWDAVQQGDERLARNLTLGPETLAFGFMADDTERLADKADDDRQAAVQAFARTSSDARDLGLGLGVAALVVMVAACLVITRLIRDPLHNVQHAAERAAEGDLEASADVEGDDETGRLARAFNAMLSKLRQREEMLLADHRRQETQSRVHRALEMADDEPAALEVVGRTLAEMLPGHPSEVLLADNSKANLEQAVVAGPHPDGPGCPVASPFSCVAVRSGSAVVFPSSEALDACPHLRNRGGAACSAVCVPVTFMGRAMGVIHATSSEGDVPESTDVEVLSLLSAQAGARIGMLRTMARTSLQASTDSLTGLMNRRTFQGRIRALRRSDMEFALVMGDIDHFKRLNDTHGHETGDRALTTFCDVARSCLRHGDFMARWGGEEFAFAIVGVSAEEAQAVLDRVRLELAARLGTSDLPGFTASYGVVDAAACESLEEAVRRADDALYEAKAAGRDRCVVARLDDRGAPTGDRVERSTVRVAERVLSGPGGLLARLANDDDPLDG